MTIQEAALHYVAHGWGVVPLGSDKRPLRKRWNELSNVVRTPEEAAGLKSPGIGLAHAYSGTAAIDIDDPDAAEQWAAAAGLGASYFDDLAAAPDAVTILSPTAAQGRFKLLYRLPERVATRVPVKGLEFRSATAAGKTVEDVLPPSPHPAGGVYEWAGAGSWERLPPIPAELLALWKADARQSDAPETGNQPDYPEPMGLSQQESIAVLARIDPDVSYPDWVRIGQALQHEHGDDGFALWMTWSSGGAKYPGPDLLRSKFDTFGHSPHPATMRSVIRDFASVATPDEFDIVPEDEPLESEWVPLWQFAKGPPMEWLIKGVLPRAALGVIYGPPGSGKSFLAFDMAAHIARGAQWNGRRTKRGRVVYAVGEGVAGMRQRAQAYMIHHALRAEDVAEFIVHPKPVPLMKPDAPKQYVSLIQAAGGADLILIDTLAQSMAGGDENKSEDMSKATDFARRVSDATGAIVVFVHHSGKDVTRGARGWSGLKGAADFELEVVREEGTEVRYVRVSKQKDGRDGDEIHFQLAEVPLGVDADGDPVASRVPVYVDAPPPRERLSEWQALALELATEMQGLSGEPVPVDSLKDAAVTLRTEQPPFRVREAIVRALGALRARKRVAIDNGAVTVL